jgi:aryl-alcohol dehydrogenase-like predicted oxidoreductase
VFGWTLDEAGSFAVLDAYVQRGGNFIDTADIYARRGPLGKQLAELMASATLELDAAELARLSAATIADPANG